jgi:hypothetical protein
MKDMKHILILSWKQYKNRYVLTVQVHFHEILLSF